MKKCIIILALQMLWAMDAADVLPKPSSDLSTFHEIAVQYKTDIHNVFNALDPAERVLVYYLYRASLPGHWIYAHQAHRDMPKILEVFEFILEHDRDLCERRESFSFDIKQFNNEVLTYLVYLWTNHSQYFLKEHVNEKRTPERIQCTALTPQHMQQVLNVLGYSESIDTIIPSIFDQTYESTLCVPGDIARSAINMYHPAFTNADYEGLSAEKRSQVNAYFDLDISEGRCTPIIRTYRIGDVCDKELRISAYWFAKARDQADKHPDLFDRYLVDSLDYLIAFLETGDEEYFKKHSIAWTKTKNRIDYSWGWIETYNDPQNRRGMFQSEVTVKTVALEKLKSILPYIEGALPFPKAFKRPEFHDVNAIPNVSINTILHSNGFLGPLKIVAAYCLPNYAEIKAKYGSKQIMYQLTDGLGKLINPALYRKLFYLPEEREWLEKYDPEDTLAKDIWTVHVLLHETIGHGSGRLATHTFKEGDKMTIENVTYNIGDTIPVTSANITEFLADDQSLEELRAEIIALYTSIFHFDEIERTGLFKDWPARIGEDRLIKELIKEMVTTAQTRLLSQPRDSNEIRGAHARANTVIMNWLLDGGGIEMVQQKVAVEGKEYDVLGIKVTDVNKACHDISILAQVVQCIKSTGDGQGLQQLMNKYGNCVRNPEHRDILQDNFKAVAGDLKVIATIFPEYRPIIEEGEVVDVAALWPKDIIEQNMTQKRLAYSTDY